MIEENQPTLFINQFLKGVIFTLQHQNFKGFPEDLISQTGFKLSQSGYYKLKKQLEEDKDKFLDLSEQRGGFRYEKLDQEEKQEILEYSLQNREASLKEIQLNCDSAKKVTSMTVSNLLNQSGMKSYVKKSTFKLTKKQIQERNQWAFEYSKKNPIYWETVVWSDESKVYSQIMGRQHVRKMDIESFNDEKFQDQKLPYHGGNEILLWGAVCLNGLRILVKIDGRLDSEKYQEVLKDHLLTDQQYNKRLKFQQDQAKCHTSNSTLNFLEKNNIKTLKWMPKGCDISPIENLWAFLKNYCYKNNHRINNKEDLWKICQEYWYSKDMYKQMENCLESVHQRVKLLRNNEGKQIKI